MIYFCNFFLNSSQHFLQFLNISHVVPSMSFAGFLNISHVCSENVVLETVFTFHFTLAVEILCKNSSKNCN